MKRKFQLFVLTKGEQRVVLLIVTCLLLAAAWRIQQKPQTHRTLPPANPSPVAPVDAIEGEDTHEQE